MFNYTIRKAKESDRPFIGTLIAEAFFNEFSHITPHQDKIALLYEKSILVHRFFICEQAGEILGIAALTDCTQRCTQVNEDVSVALFGEEIGKKIADSIREDSMNPLPYPITTGFIEYVATASKARGKGIATALLKQITQDTRYEEFVLDTLVINETAQRVYRKFGFVEIGRKKAKDSDPDSERIIMRYVGG